MYVADPRGSFVDLLLSSLGGVSDVKLGSDRRNAHSFTLVVLLG